MIGLPFRSAKSSKDTLCTVLYNSDGPVRVKVSVGVPLPLRVPCTSLPVSNLTVNSLNVTGSLKVAEISSRSIGTPSSPSAGTTSGGSTTVTSWLLPSAKLTSNPNGRETPGNTTSTPKLNVISINTLRKRINRLVKGWNFHLFIFQTFYQAKIKR